MTKDVDCFGSPLPEGYTQWICEHCTAVCNYEAMTQCHGSPCPFDRDKPESNDGIFAFIWRGPDCREFK